MYHRRQVREAPGGACISTGQLSIARVARKRDEKDAMVREKSQAGTFEVNVWTLVQKLREARGRMWLRQLEKA